MSTIFWNVLKLSPALLGASLFVASSSYAREKLPEQAAATSSSQAVETVAPTVEPLAQLPQTTVVASKTEAQANLPDKTVAASTNQAENESDAAVDSLAQQSQTPDKESSVFQQTPSDARLSGNRTQSTLAQQVPAPDNTNAEPTEVLDQLNPYSNEETENSDSIDQVTNVTQLRDVSPGDWAYEALRSLVERYGCIAGYPDGTYRGNRAMSRYEFAAGLNACLQQVERLIASNTANFVTKQDLTTLQRLIDEFRTELTTLGTRVDRLEGRTAFLETHQFSTTTKLNAEVIFAISDLFGEQDRLGNDYQREETVFQDRVRLNLDSSFTGKDRLRVRLQAGNITEFGPLRGGFSPAIPGTNVTREGRFGFQVDNGNSVAIDKLYYRFPFSDSATVFLFANAGNLDDFVPLLNPGLDSSGTGALSRFGRYSPIYRMGNQSQGAGLTFGPKSPIRVDLAYLTDRGNDPSEKAGLFDGNYTAFGQLTFQPFKGLSLGATYVNNYNRTSLAHGTGSIRSQIQTGRPVVGNSYGLEASFAFTPQLVLSGWGAYTNATVIGAGNADVWTYGATLAINDLGTKGSTLGFVFGMEPKLTSSDATVASLLSRPSNDSVVRSSDPDTGFHVEGFYKFALTKNITVTPGVIWLTAPGHNEENDDIFIGTIRTTFTF